MEAIKTRLAREYRELVQYQMSLPASKRWTLGAAIRAKLIEYRVEVEAVQIKSV